MLVRELKTEVLPQQGCGTGRIRDIHLVMLQERVIEAWHLVVRLGQLEDHVRTVAPRIHERVRTADADTGCRQHVIPADADLWNRRGRIEGTRYAKRRGLRIVDEVRQHHSPTRKDNRVVGEFYRLQ